MSDKINILILSCGTRNKIVQYFKQELGTKGLVIAADCNKLAPALYEADKYFVVPGIVMKDTLTSFCPSVENMMLQRSFL